MIAKLIDELAASPPLEINAVILLLGTAVQPLAYRSLLTRAFRGSPEFGARKQLVEEGHFNDFDFVRLVHACGSPDSGTTTHLIKPLLDRLIEWRLVHDNGVVGGEYARYEWDKRPIAMFMTLGILDNVLLGPSYVAAKYRQSVPAVFIEKNGIPYVGTADQSPVHSHIATGAVSSVPRSPKAADCPWWFGLLEHDALAEEPTN